MPTIVTAAGKVDVNFGLTFICFFCRKKEQTRVLRSPFLTWLEEEGLAAAEKRKKKEMGVVNDFIITSPEAKREVRNEALAMWHAQLLEKKVKKRLCGEEEANLDGNEDVEEQKGQIPGEEDTCGEEKLTALEEGVENVDFRKLEQVATLKEILMSKGISKVALSGLSKREKKRCPLPSSLLDEVRRAGLLFVKCSGNGVAVMTTNFYLARAYFLPVVNASFLQDWEKEQKLPNLEDYLVVGSYLKGGEVVPLKPIKEPLMIGGVFRLCSFKDNDYPVDLIRELIIRMGGRLVDEDCFGTKVYNIGSEFIQGKEILSPDWILDTLEQGRVQAKKRFVVEFEEQEDDEGIFSQVRKINCLREF